MKKFMAVVMSCAMFVTTLMGMSLTASAEAAPIVFTAQSVEAEAGDTITVDISVSENHYMVNGQLFIEYDPTALEIQTVWEDEDNPYFEEINTKIFKSSYMWAFGIPEAGRAKLAFATSSSKGTTVGGVMFTLTFKVLDDAKSSKIRITIPEEDMFVNDGTSEEDVKATASFVDGSVIVGGVPLVTPGDINGDGNVKIGDAMQAFYHVAKQITLEGDKLAAADINGDGNVKINDAMKIFYYVAKQIDSLA